MIPTPHPEHFLSRRLPTVLSLIPATVQTVVDIGYDHGKLIKQLIISRKTVRVIGVELAPHYAREFWRINRFPDDGMRERIELRQGSGLQPLRAGEADCLVFAGMGETRISRLLLAATEKLSGVKAMVLAPSHYFIKLRHVLKDLGFYTAAERLAFRRGRYFHIVLALPGRDPAEGNLIWRFAPRLFESRHPALFDYLSHLKRFLAVRMTYLDAQVPEVRDYLLELDAAIALARSFRFKGH